MRKGGYHIVDMKDANFTVDTATTISGIYESIEGSYRKANLLSGVTIADVEYADTFITPHLSGSTYEFTAYNHKFTITDDDSVTVTAVE